MLGTSGCHLAVSGDATIVGFTSAAGQLSFGFAPTPPFAGQRLFVQHTVLENVTGGFSFSNGVCIQC